MAGPTPTLAVPPTPAVTVNPNIKPLVFAAIPMDNRLKMLEGWTMLGDYITKKTGIPVEVSIKKSYFEIIDALVTKEADFCYTGPLVYVEAHKKTGVIPVVKPVAKGNPFYYSVIIVRKDSPIKKLSDLKGKKFAFTDRNSTSGYLFPRAILAQNGIKNLDFFSEVIFTQGHDSSLEAVYQKYVEAAGIYDAPFVKEGFKDPKIEEVRVIATSDPIPMGPVAIRKDIPKDIVKKIRDVFLEIGKTEETKIIGEKIKVSSYTEAHDKDYDSIRKAVKILETLGEKVEEK